MIQRYGTNEKGQRVPIASIYTAGEHPIKKNMISPQALQVIDTLRGAGYRAYIVGGAVRDLLAGKKPKDFDVATDALPNRIRKIFPNAWIIGKRFKLAHVIFPDRYIIEVATFRSVSSGNFNAVYGTIEEDVRRRDFTVNALFFDPEKEQLIDYVGGFADLKAHRLVNILPLETIFDSDPVRMLRAVRIASKLQFKIDEATFEPIARLAPLLGNVPEARLFDEAVKLLTCGRAIACMEQLRQLGLYRNVIPLLEVALKESKGERFLMLAMKRTDERIAIGKKVSPSFLFATLLWPLTYRHFEERIARGENQIQAMIEAGRYVLDKQCERLAIQKRFVEDILTIWVLQIKLLRRGTKAAMGYMNIPKFRAGYDFMLLRSQLEFIDPEIVNWWTKFQEVDEETRLEMIRQQAALNAQARKPKKGEPRKPSKAQIKKQLLLEADSWQLVRDLSGTAGSDPSIDLIDDEPEDMPVSEEKPKPKRRRRAPIRRKRIKIED